MAIDAKDLPSTPRPEYLCAQPDLQLIRDILEGTRRMHEQYKVYIPKWSAEKPEAYKKRATSAKLYGGLARSLSASVGMLFAKPPAMANLTTETEAHWENIDGKGTHGAVFAKRKAEDGLAAGFTCILVDFARVPAGMVVTAANEKALNLRPLWCSYEREDVLSWVTEIVENVETVVQVVLREGSTTRAGKFGVLPKIQYRILRLLVSAPPKETPEAPVSRVATWELVEEVKDQSGSVTGILTIDAGVFLDKDGVPFREIPLAVGYAGCTDEAFCAEPPLLPLAWCNLEHYRISSDLRYYESLCAYPQPYVKGSLAPTGLISSDGSAIPPKFQAGPGVLVHLNEGSDFGWAEMTGSTLQELRAAKQEVKDEMGELGASFLAKKTRGVETAEAKRLDSAAENASLSTAGTGIEDMLNEAWRFHALYMGIPAEQAPTVTLNKDFEDLTMDPQTMTAYTDAVVRGGFPVRVWLEQLQAGGRIGPDEDLDALAMEIMAEQAAIAQQKVDAAAQMGQNGQPGQAAA